MITFFMEEINNIINSNSKKNILISVYSVFCFIISFFWSGLSLDFWLTASALGVFIYSFFNYEKSLLLLMIMRLTFDASGSRELFKITGISLSLNFLLGIILITMTSFLIIEKKPKLKDLKFTAPWILFLSIIIILSIFSFDKTSSLIEIFRLLSFFSAFISSYFIFNNLTKLTYLTKFIIFSSLIPSSFAYWQLFNRNSFFDGERWRLLGTFVHPNMLAFYLVFIITLSIFVSLNLKKNSVLKIPYILISLFSFIPLLLTYTRAAWLALALIIFCLGVYKFKKLLLLSVFGFSVLYLFIPFFQERITSIFTMGASDSLVWRLDLWNDLIYYIKIRPWFGYGPGTSALFIGNNIPRLLASIEPHNDYLRVWLESGVFALISYIYLYVYLIKNFYQGFRTETRTRLKMLFLFIILFIISLGLASISDNIIKDSVLQWLFWALAGSLLANRVIKKSIKKEATV